MDIAQTIKQRAQERGVDPELALAIARAESGLRPQIKNPKSSAHGLFQIVDGTWKQYGGDPKKRKDVNENIRVGLEIIADNQRDLQKTFGREPRRAEVYAAHFFGKEGAKKVIGANPDALVSTVVSEKVLKSNPELLQGKTVFQALDALGRKVGDTGPGQRIPRVPDRKTAAPVYKEDPAKPPVISNAIDATRQYGAGYQAALALSYLSDTEEEVDDPEAPSVVEREARDEAQAEAAAAAVPRGPSAASMLAKMDFGYAPVVGQPQEPVRMAEGGEVKDAPTARSKALEALYGAGETALTLGTGAAASLAGMPYGLYKGLTSGKYLEGKAADIAGKEAAAFMERNTYQPRGESAKENLAALNKLSDQLKLAPTPGGAAMASLARPAATQAARGAGEAAKMLEDATVGNIQRSRVRRAGEQVPPDTAYAPLRERMEASGNLALSAPATGKAGAPAKPSVFTPLPSAEAPFVGRLDKFAAEMPGPMKKEQLLGTLKGKFKDYEIERARLALEDLPDDAKVMSTDFLNRLNNVYNPSGFRTTILEPQDGMYYQTTQNAFEDGAKTPPMGVIHLTQFIDPKTADAIALAADAKEGLYALSRAELKPEKIGSLLKWAQTQPDAVHIERMLTQGPVARASQLMERGNKFSEMHTRLVSPYLSPEVSAVSKKYAELLRTNDPSAGLPAKVDIYAQYKAEEAAAMEEAYKKGQLLASELGVAPSIWQRPRNMLGRPVPLDQLEQASEYAYNIRSLAHDTKQVLRGKAHDELFLMQLDLGRLQDRLASEMPYMGQHTVLNNAPVPIAFSRFTEKTALVPDEERIAALKANPALRTPYERSRGSLGPEEKTIKGIYLHELQSDMLDDVRKRGPKSGSRKKDEEEFQELQKKMRSMDDATPLEKQQMANRDQVLRNRLGSPDTTYGTPEAFPNIEHSPQVIQQLMVKNAIHAAIQRGDQFVAFPGKEAAEPQLYEKLPRNLDAVLKDLGPGFERRPIELMMPDGDFGMFNAVVWSPEAAQRLQKSGIPFSKGGMVERNNHDNRSYK